MTQIRFAPIIRVSTEAQEKKGESLRTQAKQIQDYVMSIGGTIPEGLLDRYAGQEHATPDQERKNLNRLLEDSTKHLFDAVIVCDPTRWSRDNRKSKEGLDILRTNGIRFFVGTMEYDLYSPEHKFYLGMSAEIGEMQANVQALKSIQNRINKAKRGYPTAGKLPYARLWDKKTSTWTIDPFKHALIKDAAKRYLAGENIRSIAKEYRINAATLHLNLNKRCGDEWSMRFYNKKLNVDETVSIKIPRLLDDTVIEAIRERARTNITYVRGHRKYNYLLAGMVFCKHCGYSMQSYRNHNQKQYYRHSNYNEHTKCDFKKLVPATELENSVLLALVQTFGDKDRIEKAIQRATPDMEKLETLQHALMQHKTELNKIGTQMQRLVDSIADGLLTKDEAKAKLDTLREHKDTISSKLAYVDNEMRTIPDPAKVKKYSKWVSGIIASATMQNPKQIFKKSYEWKRKLIEQAFTGTDSAGERLGIYITYTNTPGKFEFEIRGKFATTVKSLPLQDVDLIDTFNLEPEYQDVPIELEKIRQSIKSNMDGKCDAHNCECIYK